MSYATPQDLLDMYGPREMIGISRPDYIRTQVPDTLLIQAVAAGDLSSWSSEEQEAVAACLLRINRALEDAHRTVNSYLAGRYPLPITEAMVADSPLRGVCGDISRYSLQDDKATSQSKERYDAAIQWLRDVAGGRASLLQESAPPAGDGPGMVAFIPGRRFFEG